MSPKSRRTVLRCFIHSGEKRSELSALYFVADAYAGLGMSLVPRYEFGVRFRERGREFSAVSRIERATCELSL